MPNISCPGFRLVRNPGGSGIAQPIEGALASAYQGTTPAPVAGNVDMRVGDLVARLTNGYLSCDDNSSLYAVGTAWLGVCVGIVQYWDVANNVLQRGLGDRVPGGTVYGALDERESRILVMPFCDGQVWECQFAGIAVGVTRAAWKACIGANVDPTWAGAVLAQGRCNTQLDDTTVGVGAGLSFRIVDIPDETTFGPQDWAAVNVKAHVSANLAQQPPVGTTAGI